MYNSNPTTKNWGRTQETEATLGTQDTGRRQMKQKTQHRKQRR